MAFNCPYANVPLCSSCEVGSCNFNLADKPISNIYDRCFLKYLDTLRTSTGVGQKLKQQALPENDFTRLSQRHREEIATFFLDISSKEVGQAYSDFYTSMFSLIAQDILVSLHKVLLDPVPYRQCCVCGQACDTLWYPDSNTLPDGFGYCSYACYQQKSPPILMLERTLEVNYRELAEKLEFDLLKSRPRFVSNLVHWVFAQTPMA